MSVKTIIDNTGKIDKKYLPASSGSVSTLEDVLLTGNTMANNQHIDGSSSTNTKISATEINTTIIDSIGTANDIVINANFIKPPFKNDDWLGEIDIKRQNVTYVTSNDNTLILPKISDSSSVPKTKVLGYDVVSHEVVFQNDQAGSGPQDLQQTLIVGNTCSLPITFTNNADIKSNSTSWLKEASQTSIFGTQNMTVSELPTNIKKDNDPSIILTNKLTGDNAGIIYNPSTSLKDLIIQNDDGSVIQKTKTGGKDAICYLKPDGSYEVSLNDGVNYSSMLFDNGTSSIFSIGLTNNTNQFLLDNYTAFISKITDNRAIPTAQNHIVTYNNSTGEFGYMNTPVSHTPQTLEQTVQLGNTTSIPINFNGAGGLILQDASIERIKSTAGETTLTQNKLFVNGLTNANKLNILYYDSTTKEVTYNTPPTSHNLNDTCLIGNSTTTSINFNGIGGLSLQEASIERIKTLAGETTLTQNKLFVNGLTNTTKTNALYYDSTTKEVTYGLASSGTGLNYGTTTITFTSTTSANLNIRYRYDSEFCTISIPEFQFLNATAVLEIPSVNQLPAAIRPAARQTTLFSSINATNYNTSIMEITSDGYVVLKRRVADSNGINWPGNDSTGVPYAFSFTYRLQP